MTVDCFSSRSEGQVVIQAGRTNNDMNPSPGNDFAQKIYNHRLLVFFTVFQNPNYRNPSDQPILFNPNLKDCLKGNVKEI